MPNSSKTIRKSHFKNVGNLVKKCGQLSSKTARLLAVLEDEGGGLHAARSRESSVSASSAEWDSYPYQDEGDRDFESPDFSS